VDLEAIRRDLEQRLEKLTGRLGQIDSELRSAGPADAEDRASESENREVLDRLSVAERDELQAIRGALGRIREGTYGRCSSCGKDIAPARLETLPYTTLCVSCKT
jgi:RNA polymerase-binding transcription factor